MYNPGLAMSFKSSQVFERSKVPGNVYRHKYRDSDSRQKIFTAGGMYECRAVFRSGTGIVFVFGDYMARPASCLTVLGFLKPVTWPKTFACQTKGHL